VLTGDSEIIALRATVIGGNPSGRCFDTPINDTKNHRSARHRDRRQANKELLGKRRRNAKHAP